MRGPIGLRRREALGIGAAGLAVMACPAWAKGTSDTNAIDAIVHRFMKTFEIPGVGVALVRPGKPHYARGYGVRTLGRPERVDAHTLFAIASNTKAFTAAALALLVDDGKLGWDDPVVKHLPDFQMNDPVVTKMMTVRDLLVHRSGLSLGAGDLMLFSSNNRTPDEVMRALRYLRPARGFRAGYDYDNILYIVAGMVVAKVSGEPWPSFVRKRLLKPIGMNDVLTDNDVPPGANVAGRHARLGPPVRGMGPLQITKTSEPSLMAPAGGLQAHVSDYARWLDIQLKRGRLADGKQLWSPERAAEMWSPQTIMAATKGPTPSNPTMPVLITYALGWIVSEYRDHRMISHSGGLGGQVTWTALFPEQGIGLAVFTNIEDGVPSLMLRNALLDHLLGKTNVDWAAIGLKSIEERDAEIAKIAAAGDLKAPAGGPSLPLSAYAGRYRDSWYGDVLIQESGGGLKIDFTRSPPYKGPLEPWGKDAFRTRFTDKSVEDALLTFTVEGGKVAGLKMKALSPLADFSFDYQDLELTKVS